MKKILFVLVLCALAVSVAGEYRPLLYGRNCTDMCGDGICQQVVCMGSGCPCAESEESCPEDCENATTIIERIRERVKEKAQELNQSLENITARLRQIYKNQNRIRLAVHALLAIENRTGGIGRNISAIAREFNNSVKNQTLAQEIIQNRSRIARFFFGYDKKAVDLLNATLERNQQRLQLLEQLRQQCNCTEEVRLYLQEQIQEMQQEQERLRNLTISERKSRGILGWLWK